MTSLITVISLSKSHGAQELFKNITFTLYSNDRIGLIGPNGAGKSSLIKILSEIDQPDDGSIAKKKGLKIGYAGQAPVFPSVPIETYLIQQARRLDPHTAATRAHILLGQSGFKDFTEKASLLSGGWKKRLDIARALMEEPDFLFLDEPTNHLDLQGIIWLESFLKRLQIPYLLVSHDRCFLENVTNKIFELNPCYPEGILICQGNLSVYTKQKKAFLNALEKKHRELSFKVREELNWLKTSPKARTTKSVSRIKKAESLIDEFSDVKRRKKKETAKIDFTASKRETRKLLTAKNLNKKYGEKILFNNLDIGLNPGTRLGIVGKNGTGKSTLLKILANEITQDMGVVKYADNLKIVTFDQHREQIPSDVTVATALCPNGDTVNYRGKEIHINGWAKRFLFSPDRLQLPVGFLSGGERARILIAKLMLEPADILFLDEPTNDLDIQTLEVIEESLLSFEGALVMICHDRFLMETVCTSILHLQEDGRHAYYSGYRQWEESGIFQTKKEEKPQPTKPKKRGSPLSYKEKMELKTMEEMILEAEERLEKMHKEIEVSDDPLKSYRLLGEQQENIDALYARWQQLLDRQ